MNNKLYVGNLPFSTTEDSLSGYFGECGTVQSVKIITDRDSGRSKGFAFVEMETDEEATEAIEKFNGKDFDGRSLRVDRARPREDRPRNNRR